MLPPAVMLAIKKRRSSLPGTRANDKVGPRGCSAGFQPAGSPISNRRVASDHSWRSQAGSPAIQQVGNLRYDLLHLSACFTLLVLCLCGCAPPGPRALLKGERLIRQGKYEQAIQSLQEATRLLPTN